jgi:glycosyltransferase involved in cell wall biosynthesis
MNVRRRVSVIVPTYRRPTMLPQALTSIWALKGPDIEFEVIVCDNDCDDKIRVICDAYEAKYLPVITRGAAAARNAGLSAATGEFVAFLDDDDAWLPGHLRPHIAMLDERADLQAAVGQYWICDAELVPHGVPYPTIHPGHGDNLMRAMLSGYFSQLGTLVARSSVASRIGFQDEALEAGEDWDWTLRLAHRHELYFLEVPSILFRGRAPGAWDPIQRTRVRYARRVFRRHAMHAPWLWSSPQAMLRSRWKCCEQYYYYFVEVAGNRARAGDRLGALGAIFDAFRISPIRAAYHMIAPRSLRSAVFACLTTKDPG